MRGIRHMHKMTHPVFPGQQFIDPESRLIITYQSCRWNSLRYDSRYSFRPDFFISYQFIRSFFDDPVFITPNATRSLL